MRSSKPRRSVEAPRRAPVRRPVKRISLVKATKESEVEVADPAPALTPAEFFQQGLLSSHQKRELILAHAAARKTRHAPHAWFYIMGVAVSCLVVVAGWSLTVGAWIQNRLQVAAQPSFQESVRQELDRVEAQYPLEKPNFAEAKAALTQVGATSSTTN